MNNFTTAMQSRDTVTENGAVTNSSTGSAVLNMFANAGGKRNDVNGFLWLFQAALREDPQLAIRCLAHVRNVRGGMGERDLYRAALKSFAAWEIPNIAETLIEATPRYGRWDDMIALVGSKAESDAIAYWAKHIAEGDALACKWAPREKQDKTGTWSKLAEALGFSPRQYRKHLAKFTKVVESQMCAGQWSEINYQHTPSRANLIYRGAFGRHDATRYGAFLGAVEKGTAKIHSATLYPYDLLLSAMKGQDRTVEALWAALPDYCDGSSTIVVADTSGSMGSLYSPSVTPIHVSVSLALYCAERLRGPFKDYMITFNTVPTFHHITGSSLTDRFKEIARAPWGGSTNLQGVFELILSKAVQNNVPESDMPARVLIISDMEFNNAGYNTNLAAIKGKYSVAGYKMPTLVWWNVASRGSQFPAQMNDTGNIMVSGASPSALMTALSKAQDPYDAMLEILNGPMYDSIKVG